MKHEWKGVLPLKRLGAAHARGLFWPGTLKSRITSFALITAIKGANSLTPGWYCTPVQIPMTVLHGDHLMNKVADAVKFIHTPSVEKSMTSVDVFR